VAEVVKPFRRCDFLRVAGEIVALRFRVGS
jgi:hypothetical protein